MGCAAFSRGIALLLAALLGLPLLSLPAAAVEWQNYLEDDFESSESMFYTGQAGEAQYSIDEEEGRYVIDGLESGSDSLSALTDSMYYYYVQSECQVLESTAGDLAFCGIVFHYHKLGDGRLAYYVFYTYGDGYYGAKRVIGTDVEILLPLKKTDLFNPDGYSNTLAVDAQGTRFNLYINGDYVDGFTDMQVDGGGFGFYVSKNSRGSFDNFKVKTEKRGGSKRDEDEPSVADDGAEDEGPGRPARGYFGGYEPPEIPKDPERPLYPWEVGYDKSYRKKVQDAKEREGEDGRGADPDDADYIPDESPIKPVPEDEDSAEPDEEDKDKSEKRSARPEKKPRKETDEKRSDSPDKPAGRELPESGDPPAEQDEEPSGRKAKGGRLKPTDGFRETGGPLAPAEGMPESTRQVRPPQKGDKAPAELQDEQAQDEETQSDEDAGLELPSESGDSAADGDAEAGAEDEASLSSPLAAEGGQPMVRPEPHAGGEAEGAESPDKSASDAEAAGEDAGAAEAEPTDEAEQQLEMKPELPSRGKPKGKDKGKPKGKQKGRAKEKGSAGKGAGDKQAAEPEKTSQAADDSAKAEETAPADKNEKPAENASRQSRQGLKTGGDDWDSGNARTVPAEQLRPKQKQQDKKQEEPVDENAGESRPPAADEEPAKQADAAQPDEAGSEETALQELAEAQPEADAEGLDGFAGQQQDLGLPDSSGEGSNSLETDSASESEMPADEAALLTDEAADAGGTESAGADDPLQKQARPPARELPGEQPELESGAMKHSLLLDYVNVSTVQDDFSQQRWPVADNDSSAYRYSDGAYELDNLAAQTMAISYQQDSFVDCELSCDVSFLGGETAVGYGLAGRFMLEEGAVSYYALFVSSSGEVLLLKVLRGEEIVLSDWQPCPALLQGEANRLSLELVGNTIRASVNGELALQVEDGDISVGGYALLAGPGVAASYDNLLLRGVRAQ
ncbi:hypothetical protein IT575_03450 [bacterium]|nr:hypothetical protein [bacterium]